MKIHDADGNGVLNFIEFISMICADEEIFKIKMSSETRAEVLALGESSAEEMLKNPDSAMARRAFHQIEQSAADVYADLSELFEESDVYKTELVGLDQFCGMVIKYVPEERLQCLEQATANMSQPVELSFKECAELFFNTPALELDVDAQIKDRVRLP